MAMTNRCGFMRLSVVFLLILGLSSFVSAFSKSDVRISGGKQGRVKQQKSRRTGGVNHDADFISDDNNALERFSQDQNQFETEPAGVLQDLTTLENPPVAAASQVNAQSFKAEVGVGAATAAMIDASASKIAALAAEKKGVESSSTKKSTEKSTAHKKHHQDPPAEAEKSMADAAADASAATNEAANSAAGKDEAAAANEADTGDTGLTAPNATEAPGNVTEELANATNETAVENATNATNVSSGCVTREEPRATAYFAETAATGTPCVFGVDVRDENEHCIHDDDEFGTFGWCYTKEDKSEWGSCSEDCPLIGHHKVIGERIEEIRGLIMNMSGILHAHFGDAWDDSDANAGAANAANAPSADATPAADANEAPPAAAADAKKEPVAAKKSRRLDLLSGKNRAKRTAVMRSVQPV